MNRTRVKICGIRSVIDAKAAIAAGADALGFVFYKQSPRYITPQQARDITAVLPPFIGLVGLFVNSSADEVALATEQSGINLLQFHGTETEPFCSSFAMPYMKAVRVQTAEDVTSAAATYTAASGLLLDAFDATVFGGTGKTFDWRTIPALLPVPIILAGGLDADNVATAIQQVQPYAVDVSSGVEQSKGVKDHAKIQRFMQQVETTYV